MIRKTLLAATALAAGMFIGAVAFHPGFVAAQSENDAANGDAATKKPVNTYQQLNLFGEVFERVRAGYVEETEDDKLIEAAINGMLTSLDPHSSYMNADSYQDMQVQTRGEFGGLGIEVTMENGLIKVVSPMDDTPAARAGIQPGDLIAQLNGEPVMGLTLNEAVDKMRGEVGTSITLTILRGDQDAFEVTLKRAVIELKSARWELEDGNIGYIRITSFSEKTDSGLRGAIDELKKATKGELAGLVLDLRNNPGGLLDQAIAVSDDFMEKGEIVSTRGRNPDDAQRWNAEGGDLIEGKPIVVLVNGGSASASEIVAGALQDHGRAVILGTQSFGKGSVQSIMGIPGHGAIRLTTARYYTPSGRSIQAKGIEPDIVVEQAKIEKLGGDNRPHEADLKGALANPDGSTDENAVEQTENQDDNATNGEAANGEAGAAEKPDEPFVGSERQQIARPDEDFQLARALDLLRGLNLLQSKASN
ncbi:carboxyl-terminal processing protease [Dongia mobilis]|uniref:Carboxyl-terminal processing protease n=1 Tax=Dongia mobilis TaxID=578943 RepID=A0A4R6WR72_9PROT|nr:S41 family peptidase [Dongia mobilis]TDQ83986.1 carboxyl-terminal processing protease [Dongia mobilis]